MFSFSFVLIDLKFNSEELFKIEKPFELLDPTPNYLNFNK